MRGELFMKKNFRADVRHEPFFSDEQKEAIKQIRVKTAKKVKPLKNELGELNAHQKSLTTATKANLDKIYANIEKISDVKIEIAKIFAKQHQEIRSLLTEEQLIIFDNRSDRRERRIHQNFGKEGGRFDQNRSIKGRG
jgi:hypothetical protein